MSKLWQVTNRAYYRYYIMAETPQDALSVGVRAGIMRKVTNYMHLAEVLDPIETLIPDQPALDQMKGQSMGIFRTDEDGVITFEPISLEPVKPKRRRG